MVFTTVGIAALSGVATGFILRIPVIWDCPIDLYNDKAFFKYDKGDRDAELHIDKEKKRTQYIIENPQQKTIKE